MYKTHRLNHNFQIAHFIAGSCHTPDGMYAILCDLKDDREGSIANYSRSLLKEEASRIRAKRLSVSNDIADKLDAEAQLQELDYNAKTCRVLYDAAKDELDYINYCIEQLTPFRIYSHLTDAESNEAAQFDEWKLELMERAENYIICHGTIPPEHFETMRRHPAFMTEIFPHIEKVKELAKFGNMKAIVDKPKTIVSELYKKILPYLGEKSVNHN